MAPAVRAIDRLKKAANLVPVRQDVALSDGTTFTFWARPLTMAERDRAQRTANTADHGSLALQLLVDKAIDENGQRMFIPADVVELKNEVRHADLEKLMLAVLQVGTEEAVDMKSSGEGA